MLKALPETVRDPSKVVYTWVTLVQDLTDYGVRVSFGSPPTGMHSDWQPITNDLVIRRGVDLDDQVWVMQQMWNYLTMGPHATPAAVCKPILSLVPVQRGPLGVETA